MALFAFFQKNEDKQAFLDKFAGIPYVLLEDATDDPRGIYVMVDNFGGMQKCVEHLIIEHHLKHLVYLGGPEDNQDAIERKSSIFKCYGRTSSARDTGNDGGGRLFGIRG